jgi:hypothetical protein
MRIPRCEIPRCDMATSWQPPVRSRVSPSRDAADSTDTPVLRATPGHIATWRGGRNSLPGWNRRWPVGAFDTLPPIGNAKKRRAVPGGGNLLRGGNLPCGKCVSTRQMAEWRSDMSDPRYTDLNDPRRPGARDPADSTAPRRLELEEDGGRGIMWAWIVGIIAVIVVAMLAYDYNKPISSTADNPPTSSSPITTGAAPAPAPRAPAPAIPAPATPAPGDTPR